MSWFNYVFRLLILLLFALLIVLWHFRKKEKEFFTKREKIKSGSEKDEKMQRKFNRKVRKYADKGRKASIGIKVVFFLIIIFIVCGPFVKKRSFENEPQIDEVTQETLSNIFEKEGGVRGNYDPMETIKDRKGKTDDELVEDELRNTMFYPWYEKAPEDVEEKKEYYKANVDELINSSADQLFIVKGSARMEETEEAVYCENVEELDKIEESKVPEGYSRGDVENGVVPPLPLDAETYLWEYEMRWQCYIINPTTPMLRQLARAAMDSTILLSENVRYIAKMVRYAGYAITQYLCLMRFEDIDVKESKADCCYWIAKIFCILAENLPKDFGEFIEHCKLMSLAFCEKGIIYSNQLDEKNDHRDDLIKLRDKMDAWIV